MEISDDVITAAAGSKAGVGRQGGGEEGALSPGPPAASTAALPDSQGGRGGEGGRSEEEASLQREALGLGKTR